MAGVIDTVGSVTGAHLNVGASSPTATTQTAAPASVAANVRNPQIVQDPAVGFITQYLNTTTGQVVAQAPSALAVAYMRQGLSADGLSKANGADSSSITTTA